VNDLTIGKMLAIWLGMSIVLAQVVLLVIVAVVAVWTIYGFLF
jgi:hypothetical protein